jgi:hypothetical protein
MSLDQLMDLRWGDAVLPGKVRYYVVLAAGDPIPVAGIELRRVGCHAYSPLVTFANDAWLANAKGAISLPDATPVRLGHSTQAERMTKQTDRRMPLNTSIFRDSGLGHAHDMGREEEPCANCQRALTQTL